MTGLLTKVASWFAAETVPARSGSENPAKRAAPAAHPQASADDAALHSRLQSILNYGPTVQVGSVQLLGLESLKERLGANWDKVRERVQTIADRLLKNILSSNDVYFRHSDEVYIVVFARLGNREAQLICGRIVEELHRKLLGDVDLATITVQSAVKTVSGEILFESAKLGALLLSAARTEGASPNQSDKSDSPGVSPPKPKARWTDADNVSGPLEVMYRPALNVARQVLFLYVVRPCRKQSGQETLWGYETTPNPRGVNEILALDLAVLRSALDTYLELYNNRFRLFLMLPIHFESLAVLGRRQEIIGLLNGIPSQLRPFIVFQLEAVPSGIPDGRLKELVTALRPFCRNVMMGISLQNRELTTFARAGIKGIVVTLPTDTPFDRIDRLAAIAAAAQRLQLLVLIDGVMDAATETAAEVAGATLLSGDYIGGWTSVPEHAVHRSRQTLDRRG